MVKSQLIPIDGRTEGDRRGPKDRRLHDFDQLVHPILPRKQRPSSGLRPWNNLEVINVDCIDLKHLEAN